MEKERRDPSLAISVTSLDNYLIDVGKSTLFFFFLIGPVIYKTYYLKEVEIGANTTYRDGMMKAEDSYTTMLKQMKGVKPSESQEETKTDQSEKSDKLDQEVEVSQGPAITFDDYEKLMI